MIVARPYEVLVANELKREALEEAAKMLEKKGGNELYERAWRIAASDIRDMARRL